MKYDSDRKLWIYLHRERSLDNAAWDTSLKSIDQIEKANEIIWPNCMQLNAIDLEKMPKSENRQAFASIMTPENIKKWKESVHGENKTEEFGKIMDALRQR